jgi:hypothetical protein
MSHKLNKTAGHWFNQSLNTISPKSRITVIQDFTAAVILFFNEKTNMANMSL